MFSGIRITQFGEVNQKKKPPSVSVCGHRFLVATEVTMEITIACFVFVAILLNGGNTSEVSGDWYSKNIWIFGRFH